MKFPRPLPSWQYADPAGIVEFAVLRVVAVPANDAPRPRVVRDRFYTQARRLHVKQLMRGKR